MNWLAAFFTQHVNRLCKQNALMARLPLVFNKEFALFNKLLSAPIHRSSRIASTSYIIVQTVVQILIIPGAAAALDVRVATGLSGIAMLIPGMKSKGA